MSKKTDRIVKKAAATVAARHTQTDSAASTSGSTNVVDFSTAPRVDSSSSASAASVNSVSGEKKMRTLTRINHARKGSNIVYSLGDGVRGTVKFARSIFGTVVPDTLPENVSEWPVTSGSTPKAKMTKEERAAARAAETPAMRLEKAKAIAARAQEKAAKLEAALGATV